METFCPTLSGDPAVVFANGGYDTFMTLAPRTFDAAIEQSAAIGNLLVEPVAWNANFEFTDTLTPFQRPIRPTLDASRFEFNMPAAIPNAPDFVEQNVILDAMPVYNIPEPAVAYGARPDTPVVPLPETPADGPALVIPEEPDYVLPALPTFEQLNLPTAPAIDLPNFDGARPIFFEPVLNENWSFTVGTYDATFKNKIMAKVDAMMHGDTSLAPIEAALFGRARDRIDIEVRREIDTRVEEFGTRGFSEPNGILNLAIDEIIQNGTNRKADASRDLAIKSFEESLANTRFAVQQGIALEQMAVNLFLAEQGLALQAAQFLRETSIAILQARVTVYQAKLSGYQTDATVYAARIQGELAKIEVFKAQIEGEKARGEINDQRVRLYAEQIRALATMADFYRGRIEGIKAIADVERSKIEKFKAQIDAYSARWKAFGEEFQGYKAQIEAENSKVQVHGNLVQAYATRVTATNSINQGRMDGERLRIASHGQRLQAWDGLVRKLQAMIAAESARIGGEGQRADALARMFAADAAVETAVSASNDRVFQSHLAAAQAEVDTALRNAELSIQQNQGLTQVQLEQLKTQATVLSQLAASALSAMSFSANVSSSQSQSKSCSTSLSYSAEAPDLS